MIQTPVIALVVESDTERAQQIVASLSCSSDPAFRVEKVSSSTAAIRRLQRGGVSVVIIESLAQKKQRLAELSKLRETARDAIVLEMREENRIPGASIDLVDDSLFYDELSSDRLVECINLARDRRQMLEELRERQEAGGSGSARYQVVLNHLEEAAFLISSTDGNLFFRNEVAEAWFGDNPEAILNRILDCDILLQGSVKQDISLERWGLPFVQLVSVNLNLAGEQCCLVTLRDISQRKQAQAKQRSSEKRLELAERASNVGYWSWDHKVRRLELSKRWKDQLGYEGDEFPNTLSAVFGALHANDRIDVFTALRRALHEDRSDLDLEYRIRHRDGSFRGMACRAEITTDPHSGLVSVIGTQVELLEEKVVSTASRRLLELLANRIESASEELERHTFELRSQTSDSVALEQTLGRIEKLALRISRVNTLLSGFHHSSPDCPEEIDLGGLLSSLDGFLECFLPGETRIERVAPGGVLVDGLTRPFLLSLLVESLLRVADCLSAESDSRLLIRVLDTDGGRLEIVYSGERVSLLDFDDLHSEMRIDAYANQSGGEALLGFEFSCPEILEPEGIDPSLEFSTGKPVVLLAEDEHVLRIAIRGMLEKLGFEVILAADGAQAIECFYKRSAEIELALLDLRMPKVDGAGVMTALHSVNSRLPLILMSGEDRDSVVEAIHGDNPLSCFLAKPFGFEALESAVAKLRSATKTSV